MVRKRTVGVRCLRPALIMDTVHYPAPYHRVEIRTIDNKTIWSLFKSYLNKLDHGAQFNRTEMLHAVYVEDAAKALSRVETTLDQYRRYITILGFLDHPERARYEKVKDIPEFLTISKAKEAAYDKSWKSWFVRLEDRV